MSKIKPIKRPIVEVSVTLGSYDIAAPGDKQTQVTFNLPKSIREEYLRKNRSSHWDLNILLDRYYFEELKEEAADRSPLEFAEHLLERMEELYFLSSKKGKVKRIIEFLSGIEDSQAFYRAEKRLLSGVKSVEDAVEYLSREIVYFESARSDFNRLHGNPNKKEKTDAEI